MSSLAWGNVLPWESLKYVADGYLLPKSLMYWGTCLATWCRIGSFGSSKGIDTPMAAMILSFPYFLNARSQAVWPSRSIWNRSPRSFGWSSQITIHTQSKLLICNGDSNHRMAKSLNGEKENTIQKCILKIQNSIGYWLKEKDILHVCMVILMDLYPCFLMNSPRNCELWSNHKFRYIVCSLIWNYRDAIFSIDDQIFHVRF